MAQRQRRLMRTEGLCEMCLPKGRYSMATVVDHIKPLSQGGSDEDENTRNLCGDCHQEATAQQLGHEYRKRVTIGADGWPVDD